MIKEIDSNQPAQKMNEQDFSPVGNLRNLVSRMSRDIKHLKAPSENLQKATASFQSIFGF